MNWIYNTSPLHAIEKANDIFFNVSLQTVVYLSGGSTPMPLYKLIAKQKLFHPGAVAMVDERYGMMGHDKSNELMMRGTGLLDYLEEEKIPFYPMLTEVSLEETVRVYDETLRFLHTNYPRHVGLLGMGADGHIAGMVPQSSEFRIQHSELFNSQDLVIGYQDEKMGKRITQTFHALSLMDEIFVLVLGEEKKHALQLMQEEGSIDEVPARFLVAPEISPKVTIITDQKI